MRARLLYITNDYVPKIEIYSSLVGKVTGLSRLLRLGLPPCLRSSPRQRAGSPRVRLERRSRRRDF